MIEVILALNAGSSSIKFSLFATANETGVLSLVYRGEVEGIGSEPRFLAYDSGGQQLVDKQPVAESDRRFGHEEALDILLNWI